jgi:hypothetical protein
MALLRGKITGDNSAGTTRTGERVVESLLTSKGEGFKTITTVTTKLFEDGSGLLNIKRGGKDITITWDQETGELPDIEIHADFNGVEGALVASNLPMPVPEANDGN